MKRIFIVAVVLISLSACSQYTCPTYAQQDAPATETETEDTRTID